MAADNFFRPRLRGRVAAHFLGGPASAMGKNCSPETALAVRFSRFVASDSGVSRSSR